MKHHGSLTAVQAAMVTTLTPFLYQTRTLAFLQTSHQASLRAFERRALAAGRQFHSSVSSRNIENKSSPRPHRLTIRKVGTTNAWGPEEIRHDPLESGPRISRVIMSNQAPVRDSRPRSFKPRVAVKEKLRSPQYADLVDEMDELDDLDFGASRNDLFSSEEALDAEFEEPSSESQTPTRPTKESTITHSERETFEKIFSSITSRSTMYEEKEEPKYTLKSTIGEASKTARKYSSSLERDIYRTQEQMRADIDSYPLALRAAAAKAIGLRGGRHARDDGLYSKNSIDELEKIRQPERERVECLMRAAATDVELWEVMEQEIFPLIGKLGMDEAPSAQEPTKKSNRRKKQKAVETAPMTELSQPEAETLDLTIYGPLYPSYLLLGLRLLDRSFAKPSPLVLNVLPQIKSLGLISHVLGASTALYNELLRIYWYRYDDFRGVNKLLIEMDAAGLDLDSGTLSIVNDIIRMQIKARNGHRGQAIMALWSMPEYVPGKFMAWKGKIEKQIDERGQEMARDLAWTG
jgi:hypothetical protein